MKKVKEELFVQYLKDQIRIRDKEIERLRNKDKTRNAFKEFTSNVYKLRIDKAIEYLESYNTDFKNCKFSEAPISLRELGDLLDILRGNDEKNR